MIEAIKQLNQLLDKNQKRKFLVLFILMILFSILEFLSLGLIIPISSLIMEGSLNTENLKFNFLDFSDNYKKEDLLTIFFILFFCLFLIKFIYSIFFIYFKNKFLYETRNNFSKKIFKNYLTKPFSFHQSNNTSKLAINCKYELDIFTSNIMSPVLELMTDIIITFGLFLLLVSVDFKATFLIIFIFLLAIFAYQKTLKKKTKVWASERQHYDKLINKIIREGLGSIKEIILSFKENFFINKLNHYLFRNLIVSVRAQLSTDLPRHMLELIAIFGFVILFYFLKTTGYDLVEVLIVIGLFAAVTFKILPSFNRILSNVQRIRYGQPVISLLYKELSSKDHLEFSKITNITNTFKLNEKIEVKNLCFSYKNKKDIIFDNACFNINKGQLVGLSGKSGVGKSTFLNLISGLDKEYRGQILLDGHDLKNLGYAWTKQVAYISQNVFFLDNSIKNNIAFAEDEKLIDDKKIEKAIEAAQLKSFIESLDDGVETFIGEDGTRMSGGQLQRLAIARAFYQEFSLLILDESLNSLDSENENKIISILEKLKKDKIIFLISHKETILDNCDLKFKIMDKKILKY